MPQSTLDLLSASDADCLAFPVEAASPLISGSTFIPFGGFLWTLSLPLSVAIQLFSFGGSLWRLHLPSIVAVQLSFERKSSQAGRPHGKLHCGTL